MRHEDAPAVRINERRNPIAEQTTQAVAAAEHNAKLAEQQPENAAVSQSQRLQHAVLLLAPEHAHLKQAVDDESGKKRQRQEHRALGHRLVFVQQLPDIGHAQTRIAQRAHDLGERQRIAVAANIAREANIARHQAAVDLVLRAESSDLLGDWAGFVKMQINKAAVFTIIQLRPDKHLHKIAHLLVELFRHLRNNP